MLRENLMRGGGCLLLIVVLWTPLASASPGPVRSTDTVADVSAPESMGESGWMEVFERLLRTLVGGDEGDGGGTLDPGGAPGTTTEGGGTTETTGTTSTETTGGEPQAP